jgi:hypothetical protein
MINAYIACVIGWRRSSVCGRDANNVTLVMIEIIVRADEDSGIDFAQRRCAQISA